MLIANSVDEAIDPYLIPGELIQSRVGGLLIKAATVPKARRFCLFAALRIEKGWFYSESAREIMRVCYGVQIGAYSYGSCFRPGQFPPRVSVGRYVSIADGVSILQRNHPMDRISTHPFFFNSRLGYVASDSMEFSTLTIGHDAWIGERVTFTPNCRRVGIGAVVGASAVVTRNVPDFAIVAGNPARVIRYRFSEAIKSRILAEKWWLKSIQWYSHRLVQMTCPAHEIIADEVAECLTDPQSDNALRS